MVEAELIQTLQSISYIAGATGVCFAAYYYVMILRANEKIRRRDQVFQRLQTNMIQWYDTVFDIMYKYSDFKSVEEFRRKYSHYVNPEVTTKIYYVLNHYNNLGILLKDGLIDADLLFQLYTPYTFMAIYEKYELPLIRVQGISPDGVTYDPKSYYGIKYLYAEAKNRYPTMKWSTPTNQDEYFERGRMFDELFKKNPQLNA